ncbi:hypothetical protein D3C71_24910 [compost metagenome]
MLGYQPNPFNVTGTAQATWDGRTVRLNRCQAAVPAHILARRQTIHPARREELERHIQHLADDRFLAFDNAAGDPVILRYDQAAAAFLEEDWQRLEAGQVFTMEDLRYSERIEYDVGYGRDGSISMY